MAEVKHTPGPWFEQTGFSDDAEITAESREGMVAICSMDLDFTGRIGVEQKANARLIAAAPDLFEALQWLVETTDDPDSAHQGRALDNARAALSKATAQQEGR